MEIKKVEKYIKEKIKREGGLLAIVIDPCDHPTPQAAIETAVLAEKGGADFFSVGGSTGAQGELLDEVVRGIKERTKIPIALFPGNVGTVSAYADAIFFMSLLNSRNPYWISQAQMLSVPLIKKMKIEPLPMGYILVEPGGTAGWVGDANSVPRNKPQIAAALALSGQVSGKRFIFTDAGSDAFAPVPTEMVSMVRKAIDIPYIVGGGIKTPEQAGEAIGAGADIIQVGTAAERTKDVERLVSQFIKIIKKEGKTRIKK